MGNIFKSVKMVFLMSGLISLSVKAQETPLSAQQIMEKNDSQRKADDEQLKISMLLTDKGGRERRRTLSQITKLGKDSKQMSLIRFIEPTDVKGTGVLTIERKDREDDQWLYLPALGKTRRISSKNQSEYFMGSDFTYGDLKSENFSKHTYTITGSEKVDGAETYVLDALPSSPEEMKSSGYSKRTMWIRKDNFVNIKSRFYDTKGKFIKEFLATDLATIGDSQKWRTLKMSMHNISTGQKTTLKFTDIEINKGVSDEIFTERYLVRGM